MKKLYSFNPNLSFSSSFALILATLVSLNSVASSQLPGTSTSRHATGAGAGLVEGVLYKKDQESPGTIHYEHHSNMKSGSGKHIGENISSDSTGRGDDHTHYFSDHRLLQQSGSDIIPLSIGPDFGQPFSNRDLLRGFKVNVAKGEDPFRQKIFKGEIYDSKFDPSYTFSKVIESTEDLRDMMEIKGALSISYGPTISGKATGRYLGDKMSTKKRVTLMYMTRHMAYAKAVDVGTMIPLSGVDSLRVDDIAEKYGTKFVERVMYGAQLDVSFTLESSEEMDMLDIGATLKGSIAGGPLKIDFEAQFNMTNTEERRNLSLEIEAKASGVTFTVPANPSLDQMTEIIKDFNEKYEHLVEKVTKQETVDGNSNVLNQFGPVAFSLGSTADYLPQLNSFEAAILDDRMARMSDVFYSIFTLRSSLVAMRDIQRPLYSSDPKEEATIFGPYLSAMNALIDNLQDNKAEECMDYRRLPFYRIVGSSESEIVPVPEEYPKTEMDRYILSGLLGKAFIPSPVTIGSTTFDDIYYTGFAIPAVGDDGDETIIPWMKGELRRDADDSLVASAMNSMHLEREGYAVVNDIESIGFDFVRYGASYFLQSSAIDSRWLVPHLEQTDSGHVITENFASAGQGSWNIRSLLIAETVPKADALANKTDAETDSPAETDLEGSAETDSKDKNCVKYGDKIFLQDEKSKRYLGIDEYHRGDTKLLNAIVTDMGSYIFVQESGYESCPQGSEITSVESCKRAGLYLDARLGEDEELISNHDNGTVPCGCSMEGYFGNLHFSNETTRCGENYELICEDTNVARLEKQTKWIVKGEGTDSEGKCVQSLSKVFLELSAEEKFLEVYRDLNEKQINIGLKYNVELQHFQQWILRSTPGSGQRSDGFICGAVSAKGTWRPLTPPTNNSTELINLELGVVDRAIQYSSNWQQTSSWEKSVLASISRGSIVEAGGTSFSFTNEPLVLDVDDLFGAMLAKSAENAMQGPTSHMCWKEGLKNPGMKWSTTGPIDVMNCTHITDPVSRNMGNNNYLCVPQDSYLDFSWTSTGSGGSRCLQWTNEKGKDRETGWEYGGWSDNFLCATTNSTLGTLGDDQLWWPDDFRWSSEGIPDGYTCTHIFEDIDGIQGSHWENNHLCWKSGTNISGLEHFLEFRSNHSEGMRCTVLDEPNGTSWDNNMLCVPSNSSLDFVFSASGKDTTHGKSCINMNEPNDGEVWYDNYLCATANGYPSWPFDYLWSEEGVPKGYDCLEITIDGGERQRGGVNMPNRQGQLWQFEYEIEDMCDSSWTLKVGDIVFTASLDENPCCLPDLELYREMSHGPCKLSSPCMCNDETCAYVPHNFHTPSPAPTKDITPKPTSSSFINIVKSWSTAMLLAVTYSLV